MLINSRERYVVTKRLLDIICSSAGLVITSPITTSTAILIQITMGSPVFFVQERVGFEGVSFELIKFRTMKNQEKDTRFDVSGDRERLTKLGAFLRSSSIDELPTLWNVFLGEMSLVGPRPLLTQYLDRYSSKQAGRHKVKPGITGWAQINGRNNLTWKEKFDLDVWYVENCSSWLDFKILAATVFKVIKREGIGYQGGVSMHEFMGNEEPAP